MSFRYFTRQMELECLGILGPENPDEFDRWEMERRPAIPAKLTEIAASLRDQLGKVKIARDDRNIDEWQQAVWLCGLAYGELKSTQFELRSPNRDKKKSPSNFAAQACIAQKKKRRQQAAVQELERLRALAPTQSKSDILQQMADEFLRDDAGHHVVNSKGEKVRRWKGLRTLVKYCRSVPGW